VHDKQHCSDSASACRDDVCSSDGHAASQHSCTSNQTHLFCTWFPFLPPSRNRRSGADQPCTVVTLSCWFRTDDPIKEWTTRRTINTARLVAGNLGALILASRLALSA